MSGFGPQPPLVVDPELPWNVDEPQDEEERLAAFRDTRLVDGAESEEAVEASTQVARAQALQGRLDDASRTLDTAQRQIQRQWSQEPKLRLLIEQGRLQVMRKTPMVARIRFLEAFELAIDSGMDYHAVDAAQMMASIEPRSAKLIWTMRALTIAEASSNPRTRAWLGPLYMTLGEHFSERLRLNEALAHFESSVAFFDAVNSTRQAIVARSRAARVLRLMRRPAEALALQRELAATLLGRGETDGVVFEEIGECLLVQKRTDEASEFFGRAYDTLSTDVWLQDNEPERIRRLRTLGKRKGRRSTTH